MSSSIHAAGYSKSHLVPIWRKCVLHKNVDWAAQDPHAASPWLRPCAEGNSKRWFVSNHRDSKQGNHVPLHINISRCTQLYDAICHSNSRSLNQTIQQHFTSPPRTLCIIQNFVREDDNRRIRVRKTSFLSQKKSLTLPTCHSPAVR